MSNTDLVALLTSLIAFIASIVTLFISLWYQKKSDKEHRRVVPRISFLSEKGSILTKISKDDARVFTNIDKWNKDASTLRLAIFIKNLDDFKINCCRISINIDGEIYDTYDMGTIIDRRPVFIPILISTETIGHIKCEMSYYTETGEFFKYRIEVDGNLANRKDRIFLYNRFRHRFKEKVDLISETYSLSYSFQDLLNKINTEEK